jgi:TolB-like protein/Tfp pilus assembly protein PilF
MTLFNELKRRNVFRVAAAYAVVGWLVIEVAATIAPQLNLPEWVPRLITFVVLLGFPVALVLSWAYELTPEGVKRAEDVHPGESITPKTGRRIDRLILVGALGVIVLLVAERIWFAGQSEALPATAAVAGTAAQTGSDPQAAAASPTQPRPADNSIAVLPFTNMSDDPQQAYFADGISEELLNLLARIPQLEVTARTSSFSFKGRELAIPEIARQLHVAHVLEGSVRKSGERVRITAQLIDAAADKHLWSQSYDRRLVDIFAIQDEIAADVVKQLKITLLGAAPSVRETDPEAYALYLQAVQLGRQNTAAAYPRSDALYRQALAIDPRYAPAWVGLARNFSNQTNAGLLSNAEGYARAREAAAKALALAPDYAPVHATLGYIAVADNDLAAAAQHYEHALALAPADLGVLRSSASLLQSLGRLDEALALYEALVRRDPVNVTALVNLGIAQANAGRFDAALDSLRTALSLAPGRGQTHYGLGVALLGQGDAAGALAEIEQESSTVWKTIGLPLAYHALGRQPEFDAALAALIAKYENDWAYNIAYVHAFRGEADQAFAWLAKAVAYADPGLSEIATNHLFANLHADPRWLPFLRTIGYAPEQLAQIKFEVTLPEAAAAGAARP